MATALYGPGGFYRSAGPGPAAHFRTSVHASPLYARAVARLLTEVDTVLGTPPALDFVDIGAGRGELLTGVLAALPPATAARVRPYGVERAPRPEGLDARIGWGEEIPGHGLTGLLFANEWLDNVPVDVVETDGEGVARIVLVAPDGSERLGEPVSGADAEWLARWWPMGEGAVCSGTGGGAGAGGGVGSGRVGSCRGGAGGRVEPGVRADPGLRAEPGVLAELGVQVEPGLRAEPGTGRDAAWAAAVSHLGRGLAVAVDYAHSAHTRPAFGTLTGFRAGREVAPVPDGTTDLTAHVALDACAAATAHHGPATLTRQREALRALGLAGSRPPLSLASTDPAAYVRALAGAGEASELTDPAGLGAFGWLLQTVGLGADGTGTAVRAMRDAPGLSALLGEGARGEGEAG
ncbi:SAM-dependent methyltransferase [Streptomyces sp. DSM 41982]|uniref:SAM-dependent methyltransferase n=1 Tax=Streptomyces evansiae TaxID=3075535 RepID=A0ABD5EA81_9ACTN|nr:SAM-dependent methyltransferase [Streptomyces sp. DSM 41982]MDT0418145.1 SAM-dependent methyltransferase [Streptomyces sp. DSM 41982]